MILPLLPALGQLLTASPVPTPTDLDPMDVSPGVAGFLVTFLMVGLTVLLMVDMTRRLRRLRMRQRAAQQIVRERAEAARAEAAGAAEGDSDPG